MSKTVDCSMHEGLEVDPVVWETVLNVLKRSSDTIPLEGDVRLQTLHLIHHLQPKETTEGQRWVGQPSNRSTIGMSLNMFE